MAKRSPVPQLRTPDCGSVTGVTTTYTYKLDANYVSTETVTRNLSPVTLAVYSYTYRADGLKIAATEYMLNANGSSDTVTLTWNYDALDRLTSESSSDTAGVAALNYINLYQYDLNSDRVGETEENASGAVTDTITSSYNADNELTQSVDANNGTTTYSYDNNGSQTEVSSPTGTTTNVYDLQDRLVSVFNKNTSGVVTSSATYVYDDAGNRIEETTVTGTNSPVTTYFLVDTQTQTGYAQVIEQSTTVGTPTVSYVWGLNLIAQNNSTGTNVGNYYFIVDGHGSTVALTDGSGNVVQTFHYDGFGNALGFTPSTAITQYLYTQQYYDLASNTYYDWARNYDPATGLFDQADYGYSGSLANPMSGLPYIYGGGDPINMLDLNGHDFGISDSLAAVSISTMIDSVEVSVYSAALSVSQGVAAGETARQIETGFIIGQVLGLGALAGFGVLGGLWGAVREASLFAPLVESAGNPAVQEEALSAEAAAEADSLLAGSIRNVNPAGGTMNCVNCAIAGDATLAGRAASALPGGVSPISALEDEFGGEFHAVSGPMEIGGILSQSGNGSRGIVFGQSLTPGFPGQVFNVINQDGSIQFLDAQTGGLGVSNFDNLQNFQFLLTYSGKS